MHTALSIFIVVVIFTVGYFIEKYWNLLSSKDKRFREINDFARYAVRSAVIATGSNTPDEVGAKVRN